MEKAEYPMEELIPLVAELASVYSGQEHSSVTYEKAQMLMEAVLYCIRECQSSGNHALAPQTASAKERYDTGREIVGEKVAKLLEIYNSLAPDFQDYGSVCLRETFLTGIPLFLAKYDAKFCPQETLLSLDYPILADLSPASGIDAVLEYTTGICLEQQFLQPFGRAYIRKVLCAFHEDYEGLMENICGPVLQNTLGHLMLGKPLAAEGFTAADLEKAEGILSSKPAIDMRNYLTTLLKSLTARYYGRDLMLTDYLKGVIPDMAVRIKNNLHNHCLDKTFVL